MGSTLSCSRRSTARSFHCSDAEQKPASPQDHSAFTFSSEGDQLGSCNVKNESGSVPKQRHASEMQRQADKGDPHTSERESPPPWKRIRIASAVSGDQLCEIDAEPSWDVSRLKGEIEMQIGTVVANQRLMLDDAELQNMSKLPGLWPDMDTGTAASIATVRLLKLSWMVSLVGSFPEIYGLSTDLGVRSRAGCTTQLLGEQWLQCSQGQQLPSLASTPDYVVAFKLEIADSWRQTQQWGQILLFTAAGFPVWETYPFRCPDFVLECDGEPKLLVIVSNHDDANQHISKRGLACTDYDLPTEVELSVMLVVVGDTAAVYIDGQEVAREHVGPREAHECLEVHPNPPDTGWISMHGYEVPNEHARIRNAFYVSFPSEPAPERAEGNMTASISR